MILRKTTSTFFTSPIGRNIGRRYFGGFEVSMAAILAGSATSWWLTVVLKRESDRLKNELDLNKYRLQDLETQLSTAKSLEENLKRATDELTKKMLDEKDTKSAYEKLQMLIEAETSSRLRTEEELRKSTGRIESLESQLNESNEKQLMETRQSAEWRGRYESSESAVRMAREQAEREKEARSSLEKTIETSLKLNIERIREDLVAKTREVVGAGVVETLRTSLRQTPVLGRFGEIQLEYLLNEYFTLGELKLYDRQVTLESKKRLDAVLKLPMNDGVLHVIIDAKSPNMFNSTTDADSHDSNVTVHQLRTRIGELIANLSKANYVEHYRRHLAARNSTTIKDEETSNNKSVHQVCDFLLMFLPMDFALLAIDEKLLRKCLDEKIIVCTPSLLGLQIEFIKMAWRQKLPSDAIDHVEGDFTQLTDSLAKLSVDLDKCGTSLKTATSRAERASTRLKKSVAGVFERSLKSE